MRILRALRNLARAVVHDPIWALLALSPLRAGHYLLSVLGIVALAVLVFCVADMGLIHLLGLAPHHPAYALFVFALASCPNPTVRATGLS